MNKNNLWKKVMAFVIISLFVGVSVIPSISGDFKNKEIDENNSPMPTYIGPGVDNWEIVEIVGSWNFDENSGNVAYDSSSYENDGSCVRTQWTDGYSESGLSFIGTDNSAVMIDDDPSLDFDDLGENEGFMIDFWMQNRETSFIESYVGLISKQYQGGYMVGFDAPHTVGFNIKSPNSVIVKSVTSNTAINDNDWHHIVAVWSGDTLYIYVDDMNTPDNFNYVGDFEIGDTYKWLDFGNDWPTDSRNPFDGKIDEVKISIIKEVGENTPPRASFEWSPIKPEIDEEITFDASSSFDPDGIITLYEWDWDNDGIFDESYESPTAKHSWSPAGGYIVTLRVTDNGGLTSTKKETINVAKNLAPDVEILNPSFGDGIVNTVIIEGISSDIDGMVDLVEVKIGKSQDINLGTWKVATGTTNWNYTLDTSKYTNGTWIICSKSMDDVGEYSDIDFITVIVGCTQNNPPNKPDIPDGPDGSLGSLKTKKTYTYNTSAIDIDENRVAYGWDWDESDDTEWYDNNGNYYPEGKIYPFEHEWLNKGTYKIRVKAKDINGAESVWSDPLSVSITETGGKKSVKLIHFDFLEKMTANHFYILTRLLERNKLQVEFSSKSHVEIKNRSEFNHLCYKINIHDYNNFSHLFVTFPHFKCEYILEA